jgi:hypothetical protein
MGKSTKFAIDYGYAKVPAMSSKSQTDRFKQAARDLECDEDEARWDERLKKVAKQKPEPENPDLT